LRTKKRASGCGATPSSRSSSAANGPAANAKRYVLIGSVSRKRTRFAAPRATVSAASAFDTASQVAGMSNASANRAFRSG
jgi:hypothetical protein